jgi:hypothetical protein
VDPTEPAADSSSPPASGGDRQPIAAAASDEPPEEPTHTDPSVRELAQIPAVEVITRAAVMLMSAAAEKLGLSEDGAQFEDRDEARRLITALAGLYSAAADDLGAHRQPIRTGLRALQDEFHSSARFPDPAGQGPGEKILGPRRPRAD